MLFADAFAATPAAAEGPSLWIQILPLILIFVVFYFLLIRPQQKRMKAHRDMVSAIQKGDTIVTYGGLIGKVRSVADDELRVDIADNVSVRVVRTSVSEVRNKAPVAANDSKPAAKADE